MNATHPVILCVDDEEAILQLLEDILVINGYHVLCAVNGKEALQVISRQTVDLVLLDSNMPEMNGFEVCRQIKKDEKLREIPIIMVTGLASPEDYVRGIEAGVEDYFTKPFNRAELLARIKVLLKVKQLNDDRKRAEEALEKSYNELDYQVKLRTAELVKANEMLQADIAERKRVEEERCASELKFRQIFNHSIDAIRVSRAGIHEFVNPAYAAMFGYASADELVGKPIIELIVPEERATVQDRVRRRATGETTPISYETRGLRRDGSEFIMDVQASTYELSGLTYTLVVMRDITEKKRLDGALKEALERLASLAAHVDSMYLVDRDGTYLFMNEGHLKRFGLSWEEVNGKKHRDFHSEEDARQFVEFVRAVCETGQAITQEHLSGRDGKYFLRTFSPIIGRSQDNKISQVAVISKDITTRKLAEKKLEETLDSLRKAVNTTIRVMVSAVETRDPYTAGHQTRSADLARAIATEMGLPQEKIEGITMAGSIHDIGKLSIPAEILSKPTRLSEIEFALIKEHAHRGYEMLKDVESPWPLAEIIYQHHERMNGSGYPRNLKGEEILLEARILNVADVVEAMASHRPYRAGLGIDAALEEIEKNRGSLYDTTVSDACLRLFREKNYKLEGT